MSLFRLVFRVTCHKLTKNLIFSFLMIGTVFPKKTVTLSQKKLFHKHSHHVVFRKNPKKFGPLTKFVRKTVPILTNFFSLYG